MKPLRNYINCEVNLVDYEAFEYVVCSDEEIIEIQKYLNDNGAGIRINLNTGVYKSRRTNVLKITNASLDEDVNTDTLDYKINIENIVSTDKIHTIIGHLHIGVFDINSCDIRSRNQFKRVDVDTLIVRGQISVQNLFIQKMKDNIKALHDLDAYFTKCFFHSKPELTSLTTSNLEYNHCRFRIGESQQGYCPIEMCGTYRSCTFDVSNYIHDFQPNFVNTRTSDNTFIFQDSVKIGILPPTSTVVAKNQVVFLKPKGNKGNQYSGITFKCKKVNADTSGGVDNSPMNSQFTNHCDFQCEEISHLVLDDNCTSNGEIMTTKCNIYMEFTYVDYDENEIKSDCITKTIPDVVDLGLMREKMKPLLCGYEMLRMLGAYDYETALILNEEMDLVWQN